MRRIVHSIQGRIVLGSVAIAGVVVALLGIVVHDQLRQVAGASIANLAQEELVPFVTDLHDRPNEVPEAPGPGQLILVISPQGTTVIDTLPAGLTAAVTRSGTDTTRQHAGGLSYVAVGAQVVNARGTWKLWALRDSVSADLALQQFGRTLRLFVPIVLLLVAVGSWVLVRASLRPVRRLRTAAERIRGSGDAQQLPEGPGRDELAALARTLNGFLNAQRESVERERRMVADASHELRTPLAVLMTQLELAYEQRGDSVVQDATMLAARAQVRALARLATQLLDLSRLEFDGLEATTGRASTADLVSEVMAGVDRARTIAPANVQVELDLADGLQEDLPLPISVVAFGRIVDNLAMNAVHATPSGVVEIAVSQTATHLVLTVTDPGLGLPPEFLPRAFDRFTRSERSRASGVDGSGLGLTLVQALVHASGGRVRLANRAEGGAIATVEIPSSA